MTVGGRYDGVYVTGLFRATRDLDLDVLETEFVAAGPDVTDREISDEHPLRAVFGHPPGNIGTGAPAASFQAWLTECGDLERMPHKTVAFDVTWGPRRLACPGRGGEDGSWTFDTHVSDMGIDDPEPTSSP